MSPQKRRARPTVSSPLPLPISFALLPSLLPTKTFTPLMYATVNGLPIYLTLLPTHTPHISFLPLLISLFPTSPLHLIKLLHPSDYSRDLQGNAPLVDIWVPLPRARQLCEALGVARLFWDDKRPHVGLMGRQVDGMISWEEDHAMCHNWLPSANSIPTSSYSLDRLLSTPFGGVDIIPDDRYILTVCDPARKARLARDAETADHSRIRHGQWGEAWEGYIKLAGEVWAGYLAYPSKPPKHIPLPLGLTLADAQLIDLYSSLTNTLVSSSSFPPSATTLSGASPVSQSYPTTRMSTASSSTSSSPLAYPLTPADILACLAAPAAPSIFALLSELLTRFYIVFLSLPLMRSTPFGMSTSSSSRRGRKINGHNHKLDPAEVQRRCRIQLSLVELIGALLVDKMAMALGMNRLERRLQGMEGGLERERKEVRVVLQAAVGLEDLYLQNERSPTSTTMSSQAARVPLAEGQQAQAGKPGRSRGATREGRDGPERISTRTGRLKATHTNGQTQYRPDAGYHSTRSRQHQRIHSIDETGSDASSSGSSVRLSPVDPMRLQVTTGGLAVSEGGIDDMKRLERRRGGSPISNLPSPASASRPNGAPNKGSGGGATRGISSEDDDMTPTGHDRHVRAQHTRPGKGQHQAGSGVGSKFSFGKATKRAEEKDGDIWDPPSDLEVHRRSTAKCEKSGNAKGVKQAERQDRAFKADKYTQAGAQEAHVTERRRKAADMLDPDRAPVRARAATMSVADNPSGGAGKNGAATSQKTKTKSTRRQSHGNGTGNAGRAGTGKTGQAQREHGLAAVFEEDDDSQDDDQHVTTGDNAHAKNVNTRQDHDNDLNHDTKTTHHSSDRKVQIDDHTKEGGGNVQQIVEDAFDTAQDTLDSALDNLDDLVRPVKMRSEELGDVWMYYSLGAAVVVALMLGWMPLT